MTLRWIFGRYVVRMGGEWNWFRIVPMAGFGISGVEPSGTANAELQSYSTRVWPTSVSL